MSNIFKRLRLIGRREEREEMNHDGVAHPQSNPNGTENKPGQNPNNAREDFRHFRPQCRRSARKRLRFPSKHESEPDITCRKVTQEEIPHANHLDNTGDDTESCDAVLLKDDTTDNETGGTYKSICSADSNAPTKRGDDMNESFEVLMPDLLASKGDDLSTKKITQLYNEATPDPPVLHRMDNIQGLPSLSKDKDPGLLSVSKEDVDPSTKSPFTQAQAKKGDFQLLKLLCCNEDISHTDSLPLLSLSKDKRRHRALILGQEVGHVPLRDRQGKTCSKKNIAMIERNDLNTPLGESNLNTSHISLPVSRSSNRRKQEFNKIKECNDQGATVLESHKDSNEDIASTDVEKQGFVLIKENNEYVKIKDCNNDKVMVLQLESQRLGKDLKEATAEKQESGSNRENNELVGVHDVKTDDMLSKKENESREDIKDLLNLSPKSCESTEAGTKSVKQDTIVECFQNDAKPIVDVKEVQSEKGNHKEITSCQKNLKPTDTTQVRTISERADNESKENTVLEGEGIDSLQDNGGNGITEGTEELSNPSPKIDEGCEEVDGKSAKSRAIHVESVDVIHYKEETNDRDHKMELNGQKSAKATEIASTSSVEQMQQETGHNTGGPSCQGSSESAESAKGQKESLETGIEDNIHGVEFNEDDNVEVTKRSIDQSIIKTTESLKVENRFEDGVYEDTNVNKMQVGGFNGVQQQNREPDGCKNLEHVKPTEFKKYLSRKAESQLFALTGPQDAQISTNLSPTITPRKMYEMFAAPNSSGKFNGSLPMADKTISQVHVPRKRGRPRKIKTERQQKVKLVNNNNAYNMQTNNLEWSRMVSAPGTLHSQGDGMFMLENAIPQGQPQEFGFAGGFYTNMMSLREEIPLSNDDTEAARAASSGSGMDSQGTGQLKKDSSGSKATNEGEDGPANAQNYRTQVNPFVQPYFDGLYMIDGAGGCFPVHPPYGTMIPPLAFQAGTFGPYGYSAPINGPFFPNQPDARSINLGANGTGTSKSTPEQNDRDNKIILDSSHSIMKADADGDETVFGETNQPTLQDMTDINDALKILLGDAFDPSISDPGERLAMYGAELLKDEELRMEFIYFCERLLNHEMMMSQSGGFFPGAFGDFTYPCPIPFPQPSMWPPPGPCPPGWYPNDIAYYYDGESYIPIGPVQPEPQGNLCMMLPNVHPDHFGQPQGAGDYMPIYATPGGTGGNAVCMEQFHQAGGNRITEQSGLVVC